MIPCQGSESSLELGLQADPEKPVLKTFYVRSYLCL